MQFLKQLFIGIIGMFVVVTIISSFLPSVIRISRGVVIHAAPGRVYHAVSNLNTWKEWNPLLQDSSSKIASQSTNELKWQFGGGGLNTILVKEMEQDTILTMLTLSGEPPVESGFAIKKLLQDSSSTQAEWWIIEKLRWYPWEKFYGIFADRLRGPYLDSGLTHLKDYVENEK